MSKGIYKYTDLKTGEIVYIGKDSNIGINKRHKAHNYPSKYDDQPFNRILQKNPECYEYGVIWETENCTDLKLNKMEILFGKIYNPKFNFDKFGKGGCNGHTEETKQKMSESRKRENNSQWKNYARIIKHGFKHNKQVYVVYYEGKILKSSHYIHKLYKWFGKNYPNQYLYLEV